MITLEQLLRQAVEMRASDLHLEVGSRPALRVQSDIRFLDLDPLTSEMVDEMILPLLSEEQYDTFIHCGDVDFSHELPGISRFRVSALNHYRGRGAVFRVIPNEIPTLAGLGLPPVLEKVANLDKGLVIVAGPTGCGKSTTLAAMLGQINERRSAHVLTIEDPIEYIHPFRRSYIEQRELGQHAVSFADALRASLRESPDVVMVGEMRDLDTMREALRAAETGYLVFSTLHTNSAAQTLNRIVDVFPPDEQHQIRSLLSGSLKAVVCQQLLPRKSGGRVAAMEIMLVNMGIAGLIREGKTSQIGSFLLMGRSEGMQTLDLHLVELLQSKQISLEVAYAFSTNPEVLARHGYERRGLARAPHFPDA
ncbi:MAG: type IV pilus twitching motility protein PilT [Candidatus Xenobium sp.]|jgi:twitching motility protein PilT|nr:type IV pilus twitching motility protein PilT [Burkholderiales bacterium]